MSNELDRVAAQEAARAMAEGLTEDPNKQILIAEFFVRLWERPTANHSSRQLFAQIYKAATNSEAEVVVYDLHALSRECTHIIWSRDGARVKVITPIACLELCGDMAVEFWKIWSRGEKMIDIPAMIAGFENKGNE